jgi:hypothetical protein
VRFSISRKAKVNALTLVKRFTANKIFTDLSNDIKFFGGYSGGVTPDLISNSEVKSACADGTARCTCGRVRRRRILFF